MSAHSRSLGRLAAAAMLASSPVALAQYPFPGSSADLPAGTYWWIASDHAGTPPRDLEAVRFHPTEKRFTRIWPDFADYATDPKNIDWILYGVPVQAIADGVVISCWRNAPEGLKPDVHGGDSVPHPGRTSNPLRIPRSGNHLVVRTDDGKDILYAHMQPDSVPTELCPHDAQFVNDAEDRIGDYPRETLVPISLRARVERGQDIGRVGSSGASAHPHLHIHIAPVIGTYSVDSAIPLPYHEAWQKPGSVSHDSADDFVPLQDEPLMLFPAAIHPDPLLRRGDVTGAVASEVEVTASSDTVVTATRNAAGQLAVNTWRLAGDGTFTPLGGAVSTAGTQVALARPGVGRDVVTGLRTSAGNLQLTAWRVATNGALERKAETGGGAASEVALAPLGSTFGVVSAVRNASGRLQLTTWDLTTDLASFSPIGTVYGPEGTRVALTYVTLGRGQNDTGGQFSGAVTAVRNAAGNLELTTWQLGADQKLVQKGSFVAGTVSDVALSTVSVSNFRELVVASVRTGSGLLRNIAFEIDSAGQLTRREDADGGHVTEVRSARVTGKHLVTSVRDTTGRLRLYTWDVDAAGEMRRTGESLAGGILSSSVASTYVGGRFVVSAVRLTTGEVRLIAWDAALQ
ncbi:M23 family metallopeptidase [Myxococcus sp. K15C18031901]|uniref:M23 family metallopeptidase n=1 Tax=Myxococcus dinghuensis TaxID=2906761 RepID=UPI0020A74710|nr:M23 family metallopeptidase [Myxococcus dinghuensis]MCP3098118.1 M23 family metallopeptidase [Myxococcus dinghuensis]